MGGTQLEYIRFFIQHLKREIDAPAWEPTVETTRAEDLKVSEGCRSWEAVYNAETHVPVDGCMNVECMLPSECPKLCATRRDDLERRDGLLFVDTG